MIIPKLKAFLALIFLAAYINGSPLIVPITFRPSMSFKHTENDCIRSKVGKIVAQSVSEIETIINVQNSKESRLLLRDLRTHLTHFSMKNLDLIDDSIKALENVSIAASLDGKEAWQTLRMAVCLRATLELFSRSHEVLVDVIRMLEKNEHYWDQQYAHLHYYIFHRSPLKWFTKKSFKYEIMTNKKLIADMRCQYEKMLGEQIFLLAKCNDGFSVKEQFLWIKECCIQMSSFLLSDPLKDGAVTQEQCLYTIKRLYKAVNNHDKHIQKKIKEVTMPSFFERNWAVCTGVAAAAVVGYLYLKKNPHIVESNVKKLHNFLIKNYTNHLKEPLTDIKRALFVTNDEVALASLNLKKLISETKPSQETSEKLKKDYLEICTTIAKTLDIRLDNQELMQKADQLNQDYLDNLCQSIANSWKKGGYLVESYFNPFETTTKSKVLNVLPDLGILIYRVAKLTGRSLAINGAEVLISRINELEKKLNLAVAAVSLLPAYFAISRTVMAVRSFGGFLLPKGYDDTPIKDYITKIHDLLDDIFYINRLNTVDELDAASLGRLYYYSSCLEEEAEHLSQKNHMVLKTLLEKFYITNDLKGKHLYLEKMLHEYHSWPHFIKR